MTNRYVSIGDLKAAFHELVKSSIYASRLMGVMGRWDGGTSYTFTVPGNAGKVYVRLLNGDLTTVTTAINEAGVTESGVQAIWLERRSDGRLYITGPRYEGA